MYKIIFKRWIDIIVAIFLIPFWLLLFIIFGPVIYYQDRGPIFYNAKRLGKDGSVFTMYKFRSMKINSPDLRNEDGSTFNSENDTRLTAIGSFIRKTSIDETPQIFNVLKGDMSFVGPRPDLPEHMNMYVGNQKRKLEIRPGITGYNQAFFRNTIPWKERINNDIYYIDKVSFIFDTKIIIQTIISVVKSKDVFANKDKENSIN